MTQNYTKSVKKITCKGLEINTISLTTFGELVRKLLMRSVLYVICV